MRRVPKKPRTWLFPAAEEREYVKALLGVADEVERAVRDELMSMMRSDAIEDLPPSAGEFEVLRQGVLRALRGISLTSVIGRVTEFAQRVAGFNKQQFHAVVRSAYEVDVFVTEPWLADVLKVWEAQNIALITSIPEQALTRMHGKVFAALQRGAVWRDVQKELVAEFGITRNRAELIARDQIGKLNADLTKERQKQIGVKEYRWRGVLDGRERDEHRDREGKVFAWDAPPPDGHPGQPIQCRCHAEAVLPLFDDLMAPAYDGEL